MELIFKEVDRYGSYFTLLHEGETSFHSVSDRDEQILELSSQWELSRFQLFLTPGRLVCAPFPWYKRLSLESFLSSSLVSLASHTLDFFITLASSKASSCPLRCCQWFREGGRGLSPSWREWKLACVRPSGLGGVPAGLCELSRMISS